LKRLTDERLETFTSLPGGVDRGTLRKGGDGGNYLRKEETFLSFTSGEDVRIVYGMASGSCRTTRGEKFSERLNMAHENTRQGEGSHELSNEVKKVGYKKEKSGREEGQQVNSE